MHTYNITRWTRRRVQSLEMQIQCRLCLHYHVKKSLLLSKCWPYTSVQLVVRS